MEMTQDSPRIMIVLGQRMSWPEMLARTLETERLGFDGLYLVDHYFGRIDLDEPTHEGWTMLAALAPFTQRMRLGMMVSGNTYRNPAFLLKQAITVDHISGGRVDFGVGAGWQQREHEAYGFPLPPPKERIDRFEEALQIWEQLQANPRTTFEGEHYQLLDAPFQPKSLQSQGLPLLIGSTGPRMMRLVARHAAIWNVIATPEDGAALNARMDKLCEDIDRDPSTLIRGVSPSLNLLESPEAFASGMAAYVEAGFQDICMPWPRVDAEVPVLREVARTILPALRGESTGVPLENGTGQVLALVLDAENTTLAAAVNAFGDDPAGRFLRFLAAHPDQRFDGASLREHLGLDSHEQVTRAAIEVADGFARQGLDRPWEEAQSGYLMPREVAARIMEIVPGTPGKN
jgi:alkanesulfonate monooxygenase SsuD/methylene tetrahydromethanopterin reductase-like flavin-dependent oxidoreductase (luciferase family)